MCLKCWKHLQITYTFKKDYLEVERKIRIYCQDFRLRHRNLTLEALEKVRNYFSDEYCEIMTSNIKQEHGIDERIYAQVKTENISNRISHIKTENGQFIKKEIYSDISTPRKQVKFTSNDNKMLISVYFEVTKNEQDFHHGYWQRLYDKWTELNPDKPVDGKRLSYQIRRIIRRKLLPKAQLEKIRAEVNSKIKAQTQPEQIVEHYSDSDDSFMEEAVHSSFTPHIKSEPLSESDVEINLIEPKLEVESDCESLPQLERMDLPPLHFKIENIYSLEVKREAYDNYLRQEEELSNMQVEELNKNRRVSLRGHNKDKDLFKCPDCSFETTHGSSAQRHMKLHQKRNQKIYQCTSCPYRIFSKWLFNRHMKKHKEEENDNLDRNPSFAT
ncbi:hypothetical protein NQ314_018184 [Rhamnusium bicolor]|uniref:C2H2-type domain-containing protein n=1 Tax=Rhamnusium bicolor TaxID=1586634 RepID=A0AAV8WSE0_9CUCU|nr:hypothetical protein NQ314_018184 [Rhamnusium bicolor]